MGIISLSYRKLEFIIFAFLYSLFSFGLPRTLALQTQHQGAREDPETILTDARRTMVERDIAGRGIKDQRVLRVMGTLPRHFFVPEELRSSAYHDRPLPIGAGQTISQPYIVAFMTELLELKGREDRKSVV